MISRFRWTVQRLLRQVWVRSVAFAVLGVATALVAVVLRPLLPADLGTRIGAEAVDQILGILASSMLAVTTFSLSIMVSAMAAAAGTATPRATELLKQDGTSQQVLATFVGAFLFALVGLVALKTGIYGESGRLVLFLATLAVLVAVVVTLLRWIAHLMHFGRLADTLDRLEAAASAALATRAAQPFMGGHPLRGAPPGSAAAVAADCTGYVQHVDLAALQRLAEDAGRDLFLAVLPGSFVHPAAPLAHATGLDDDQAARLRAAFSVGRTRTYDQDPRFGLIALAETASRALSPAVNDPGTAIEVTGRLVRVLLCWREAAAAEVLWPRLHVPPIRAQDLMQDAFRPIARDGAALVEVQVRLLKALKALAAAAPDVFAVVAADQTAEILARADKAGLLPGECARLAALGQEVATLAEGHRRPGGM